MNPFPPTQNAPTFEQRLVGLYPRLLQAALYLCSDQADAHDLVQDAIERGLRCRDRFCSGDTPEPWMLTILRRLFIDRYRAQRARGRHLPRAASEPAICAEAPTHCPWERFTTEDVRHASQLLAPLYREVFILFTFDKLSQRQIARRLSLSASTVATRLVRARHKLRALLESGRHQDPTQRAEKLTEGGEKSSQALPATPDSPASHPEEPPGTPTSNSKHRDFRRSLCPQRRRGETKRESPRRVVAVQPKFEPPPRWHRIL